MKESVIAGWRSFRIKVQQIQRPWGENVPGVLQEYQGGQQLERNK